MTHSGSCLKLSQNSWSSPLEGRKGQACNNAVLISIAPKDTCRLFYFNSSFVWPQEFPTHKECHLKREKEKRKRENINYKTCKKFCCGLWQPIHGCYCYCCCCCSPFYESVLEAFELFDTFLHTFLSDQLFYRRGACFLKSFFLSLHIFLLSNLLEDFLSSRF